ncbi:MAG: relaxase/mobilization nuclease domain-containing protein [Suipraeoptans sp.]
MAITKLMHMKEGKGRNPSSHLKNAIEYILNPEKTDNGMWIGGNTGHETESIYNNMLYTKNLFEKTWGRQGYHFVISFSPDDEVDEGKAFMLTEDFCNEYFGDTYGHVFTIHNDKDHMHAHIIFNSLNAHGKKYRYEKGEWESEIQPIVNKYCRQYGLSELDIENLETRKKKSLSYEKHEQKSSKKNWNVVIREDIDYYISQSETYLEFLDKMIENGYEIKTGYSSNARHEYLSLKCQGMERSRRNYRLGENYGVESIKYRIENKEKIQSVIQQAVTYPSLLPTKIPKGYFGKVTGYQRYYLKRIYRVYRVMNRFVKPYPQAYKYKKDLIELERLQAQYNYLYDNKIINKEELILANQTTESKMKILNAERNRLYHKRKEINSNLQNNEDSSLPIKIFQEELEEVENQLKNVKEEMKYVKNEKRLAETILTATSYTKVR